MRTVPGSVNADLGRVGPLVPALTAVVVVETWLCCWVLILNPYSIAPVGEFPARRNFIADYRMTMQLWVVVLVDFSNASRHGYNCVPIFGIKAPTNPHPYSDGR